MAWLPFRCVGEVCKCVQYVSSNMFQICEWQDSGCLRSDVSVGDMVQAVCETAGDGWVECSSEVSCCVWGGGEIVVQVMDDN